MTSFSPGDHVAIISGRHAGDTGKVVDFPSLRGVPVDTDGRVRFYDPNQLILDMAREGSEALAGDAYRPVALEAGRPLPRRMPRLTLGQFWAAQAASRRPFDPPIAYVLAERAARPNVPAIAFGGVA